MLLLLRFRGNDLHRLQLRHGQCPAIHLAIWRKRQPVQPHIDIRHHIGSKRLGKLLLQLCLINAVRCGVIRAELLGSVQFQDGSHRTLNARKSIHRALYFTKFNAEPPQLHLLIDTTNIFQFSLFIPAYQVTGTIHSFAWRKWSIHKSRGGLLRKIPIAARHLAAQQAKLTGRAARQQLPGTIHNSGNSIRHSAPDGNIIRILYFHPVIRGCYGKFCWAVAIIYPYFPQRYRLQPLAAQHQIAQRQIILPQHFHPQLCGQCHAGNFMIAKILIHSGHILAKLRRQNMKLRPCSQRRIKIMHRRVKAETDLMCTVISRTQFLQFGQPRYEILQSPVLYHDPLGPAGGT